jgi:hypothetical protein
VRSRLDLGKLDPAANPRFAETAANLEHLHLFL